MRPLVPLLLLAALAAGVLWWLAGEDGAPLLDEDALLVVEEASRPPADVPPETDGEAAPTDDDTVGLPRILPPDAAVEDVRDALAARDTDALGAAYAALGRIARTPRIRTGIQRHLASVDDPVVRGVTLAALGIDADGSAQAWLVARVAAGPADADRLGALLALAHDGDGAEATIASLGGLGVRAGVLPTRVDLREALGTWLPTLEGPAARDALPVLERSLAAEPAWFAALKETVARVRAKAGA